MATGSARPICFVDVDGVINCFGDPGASLVSFDDEFLAVAGGSEPPLTIRVPAGCADRLRRIAEHCEMVWATSWMGHANETLSPRLGLPTWPYVVFPDERGGRDWKLTDIDAWAAGRPCCWIDDDLGDGAYAWAAQRSLDVAPTLLVRTEPSRGLTEPQAERIIAWARRAAS